MTIISSEATSSSRGTYISHISSNFSQLHLFIGQSFYHVVTLPSDNVIQLGLQSIKLVIFNFGPLGGILELFDIKNKVVY